jgi:phospholipid N-methyltransferase
MDSSDASQAHPAQLRQFFRSWVQNPFAIGAVAPSGRKLAQLMVKGVRADARVMELGPGTGTVTRAILDSGVDERNLYLVERDAAFVRLLRQRFPKATLLHEDATALGAHTRELAGTFDFIVSGLPLVLFSRAQKERLLAHVLELLKPTGAFHQFTYGGRCPIRRSVRDALGLDTALLGIAPFNVPPAFVYRLCRAV